MRICQVKHENRFQREGPEASGQSGVVESLLSEFVERESRERLVKTRVVEATIAAWNRFNAKSGSIADQYSSL